MQRQGQSIASCALCSVYCAIFETKHIHIVYKLFSYVPDKNTHLNRQYILHRAILHETFISNVLAQPNILWNFQNFANSPFNGETIIFHCKIILFYIIHLFAWFGHVENCPLKNMVSWFPYIFNQSWPKLPRLQILIYQILMRTIFHATKSILHYDSDSDMILYLMFLTVVMRVNTDLHCLIIREYTLSSA